MNNFLPEDYKMPTTWNDYTKFEDWVTTRFRILPSGMESNCIVFWEYFDLTQGEKWKPVRSTKKFTETPWIESGRQQGEKWAFKVWNYDLGEVQICSIWQILLKQQIMSYINDDDYGNPVWYDIKIRREWVKLETKYSLTVSPPKDFDESLLESHDKKIDWVAYLEWEDPFLKDN